ncbi:MAG: hypothetical protein R2795_03215 [Saprospiraceae bacterium]
MRFTIYFLLRGIIITIMLAGCKKESPTVSDVSFEFAYNFSGQDFDYNTVYDVNGTK